MSSPEIRPVEVMTFDPLSVSPSMKLRLNTLPGLSSAGKGEPVTSVSSCPVPKPALSDPLLAGTSAAGNDLFEGSCQGVK